MDSQWTEMDGIMVKAKYYGGTANSHLGQLCGQSNWRFSSI